jgi:hypothetical protein
VATTLNLLSMRMPRARDISDAVPFLACDEVRHVTGVTLSGRIGQ